jgi:hypothetical protein
MQQEVGVRSISEALQDTFLLENVKASKQTSETGQCLVWDRSTTGLSDPATPCERDKVNSRERAQI